MNLLSKKNKIILVPLILYILLYFILILKVLPNYSTIINCIFITVLCISSFILYKFDKFNFTKLNKRIIKLVFVSLIIYLTINYALGLFTGYGREVFSIKPISLFKNTVIPLVSLVMLELFRYIYISNNKDNRKNIYFFTFLVLLLDIMINIYIFDFTLKNLFIFITVTVLPLLFKNVLMSYLTYKIGYYPCLLFVVTLCIYKYAIIIKPNLGNYLSSVINIAYPALLYIYSSRMISYNEDYSKSLLIRKVLKVILLDIPLLLFFTILVGLISGYFKYYLIGVQSSSIKGINKGDAVMIDTSYTTNDYEVGDIIAYSNGKKIIIDKISKQDSNLGIVNNYVTTLKIKGKRDKYKKIEDDMILGKYVNFKIRKIAIPTIKFKELIKGDLK